MQKWEYLPLRSTTLHRDGETLDTYGEKGWELVTAIDLGGMYGIQYILKRPKE